MKDCWLLLKDNIPIAAFLVKQEAILERLRLSRDDPDQTYILYSVPLINGSST